MALCQIWNSKVVIMKDLQKIFIILAILFAGGCSHSDDGLSAGQKGTLVVSLNTPIDIDVEQTRVDLGDGNLSDGGGMEDLLLVLVNPNNKVVAKKFYEYNTSTDTWSGDELSAYEGNKSVTTSFTDLDVAIYKMYTYANINRSLSYFGDLKTMLNNIVVGNDFALADATFADLGNSTPTTAPTVDASNPMLLTACEEVHIEVGTTQAVVEMLRPLVEFNFKVVNHSSKQLNITYLKFKNFNPQTSYITPHDAIYAEDATNNIYRELPASGFSDTTPAVIAANGENGEAVVYKTYLYENTAPSNRYQFDIDLELPDAVYETTQLVINEHNNAFNTTDKYLLKNGNYFLMVNGDNLTLVQESALNATNITNAEFKFSGTTGYLYNVGTEKRFYSSTSASGSVDDLTFSHQGSGVYQIYYQTSSTRTYYLRRNDSSVEYKYNRTSNRNWQLYKSELKTVTTPVDPLTASDQQISYIQDNGVAAPLTQMLRNQKVTVTLNVYFEETSGVFRFYVEEWSTGHNNSTTFD